MLGHKASLDQLKRTEIISSIFSDHNGVTLEINYKNKTGKFTNMGRLNNTLQNNRGVKEEIKRKIKKKILRQAKWKCNIPKFMGCSKSSSKEGIS